jgi:valyl-tRNA synthetase
LIASFGSDAVRYWAANGRPGMDVAFDQGQMKIGRRLSIKLLNASKFALSFGTSAEADAAAVSAPLDKAMLAALASLVDEATGAFDRFDYARAIERTETFFWSFCDDYLELVKNRAYGGSGEAGQASAQAALGLALQALLKLFAPILPFVTEEVWSWWQEGSIHRSPWPSAASLRAAAGADATPEVLAVAGEVVGELRKVKSEAKRSMRTGVTQAVVSDTPERLALLAQAIDDVRAAGVVAELTTEPADVLEVKAELEPPE